MSGLQPRLAITPGEPAGIGPDICLKAFDEIRETAQLTVFADINLMRERSAHLDRTVLVNDLSRLPHNPEALNVHPVPLANDSTPGKPDTANSNYVIETLEAAVAHCIAGSLDGLVTGPINKALINEAGVPFSGHTEWLAARTGTPRVVMMLAGNDLRVALATTHLPLREVSDAITSEALEETLSILHRDLETRFGLPNPRILVCGLNPHAGEEGHLGHEEIDTIIPVIRKLANEGMDLRGPLPADTLFTPQYLESADAVLAMYHDQGLPVLKHATFGQGVNITLGLPIIRTSVDHGTAFDLAGSGNADHSSLVAAVNMAAELCAAENLRRS